MFSIENGYVMVQGRKKTLHPVEYEKKVLCSEGDEIAVCGSEVDDIIHKIGLPDMVEGYAKLVNHVFQAESTHAMLRETADALGLTNTTKIEENLTVIRFIANEENIGVINSFYPSSYRNVKLNLMPLPSGLTM